MLQEKVRQSSRAIRKLYVASPQNFAIRAHMIYRLGLGFYLGSAWEEEGRRSGDRGGSVII